MPPLLAPPKSHPLLPPNGPWQPSRGRVHSPIQPSRPRETHVRTLSHLRSELGGRGPQVPPAQLVFREWACGRKCAGVGAPCARSSQGPNQAAGGGSTLLHPRPASWPPAHGGECVAQPVGGLLPDLHLENRGSYGRGQLGTLTLYQHPVPPRSHWPRSRGPRQHPRGTSQRSVGAPKARSPLGWGPDAEADSASETTVEPEPGVQGAATKEPFSQEPREGPRDSESARAAWQVQRGSDLWGLDVGCPAWAGISQTRGPGAGSRPGGPGTGPRGSERGPQSSGGLSCM